MIGSNPKNLFCFTENKQKLPPSSPSRAYVIYEWSDSNADSSKTVEDTVKKIISDNPDLSQVHYLAYLNALRTNDYCTAVKSLYWSFDRSCQCESFLNPEMDTDKLSEEVDRGFRYAALNLAALHANFQVSSKFKRIYDRE